MPTTKPKRRTFADTIFFWEENTRSNFAQHVAELATYERRDKDHDVIKQLRWRRPNYNSFSILYLIKRGLLIVTGDCGTAIYGFHESLTFAWLSELHLSYFASKYIVADGERNGQDWFQELVLDCVAERRKQDRSFPLKANDPVVVEAASSASTWEQFLLAQSAEIRDYELGHAGYAVGMTIRRHFIGLQLAVAQLGGEKGGAAEKEG